MHEYIRESAKRSGLPKSVLTEFAERSSKDSGILDVLTAQLEPDYFSRPQSYAEPHQDLLMARGFEFAKEQGIDFNTHGPALMEVYNWVRKALALSSSEKQAFFEETSKNSPFNSEK